MSEQHSQYTTTELVEKSMEFLNECAFTIFTQDRVEEFEGTEDEKELMSLWATAMTIALHRTSNLMWSLHQVNKILTLELNKVLKQNSHDEDSIVTVLKNCQEILSEI
jgi:hypothetical protein